MLSMLYINHVHTSMPTQEDGNSAMTVSITHTIFARCTCVKNTVGIYRPSKLEGAKLPLCKVAV